MKNLIAILFLFAGYCLHAQDYSCFTTTGTSQYFINSDGYLRGMRIDSAKQNGSSTIYYPFLTRRYYDSANYPRENISGSSWLGKNVIALQDGTYIFNNRWDTVVIKTKAAVGDTWIFYNDSTTTYYKATVASIDTMTIVNSFDSVKTIRINAYNGLGINAADPMNDASIILSKHNGFFQVFDLYMFPMHDPKSQNAYHLDYYLDYSTQKDALHNEQVSQSNQMFRRVDFHNPTMQEIHDYNIGDVFEKRSNTPAMVMNVDTIVSKTLVNPNEIDYIIHGVGSGPSASRYTDTIKADTTRLLPSALMPEESPNETVYWYRPDDTTYCFTSLYYATDNINVGRVYFEPRGTYSEYKLKMGEPNWKSELIFSKKNNIPCGIFFPLGIAIVCQQLSIAIYPNPATDKLYITFEGNGQASYTICLTDLLGKTISTTYAQADISIPVNGVANGIYLLHIADNAGNSMNEKIVVQH